MPKTEFEECNVSKVCETCKHLKTIRAGHLYRCMKYSFRKVAENTCPEHEQAKPRNQK